MIDIGINLTSAQFDRDWEQVAVAARQAGVDQFIVTGTSIEDSVAASRMAKHLKQWCTSGVHPHNASQWRDDTYAELMELHRAPDVVAVGECGLDFNRNFSTPSEQELAFEQQIQLALVLDKPLFLHCRDAHQRFAALLMPYKDRLRAVVHCFTGTHDELLSCLDMGFYIGITGWICDERRGQELRKLVPEIPLERLLLETDGPYLLPRNLQPLPKNRRNEPKYLPHIASEVASLYGLTISEIDKVTSENARNLFKLNPKQ